MTAPSPDRAAVVLCGGKSERMGRPKASLPFGTETLLARVVRTCAAACGEVVVVAAEGQEVPALPPAVRVVRDRSPGAGPLEGMAAGLAAVAAPVAFVASCDAPFLTTAFAERMFAVLGDRAAAQAVVNGYPEPLQAVYRTSLAGKAAGLVAAGRRRAIFLVEGEAVALVPDPDPLCFRNVNTPEEYREALRLLVPG